MVFGCNRAEGSNWPFKRKDNLANHIRGVHRPDKPHRGGHRVRNQIRETLSEDGSSSAFSTNPLMAGTTGFADSLGEHSSSPNTSNDAASTADAGFGISEYAEAADADLELDPPAFADFVSDWGMYQDAGSFSTALATTPQNALGFGAAKDASSSAIAPPIQIHVKRKVFDVVRNEFVVGRSPLPSHGSEVQPPDGDEAEGLEPVPSVDIPMLDNFDFEAFGEMPLEFANDDFTGLFDNSSSMVDTDHHS